MNDEIKFYMETAVKVLVLMAFIFGSLLGINTENLALFLAACSLGVIGGMS